MYQIAFMEWKELINQIIIDFRLSGNQLAQMIGVAPNTINRIRNGSTPNPFPDTIGKIEKALNIKIDDSDPENITYTKVEKQEEPKIIEHTLRLINDVAAGVSEVNEMFQEQFETITISPQNMVLMRIQSEKFSMAPAVMPGDMIILDYSAKPKVNDMVVVGWRRNGNVFSALKYLSTTENVYGFHSNNAAEPPIFVTYQELIRIVKVVQVIKQ
ncbi:MAG: S24 family peptidase [Vampirovibrionia bacterium]